MGQAVRIVSALQRYYHTLRYLKPVQFYGRLWFRLYKTKVDHSLAPALNSVQGSWLVPVWKQQSLLEPWRFRFLRQENVLKGSRDWNNPEWEKLWLYNLHYFDDLCAEGAENRKNWHGDLIEKWIKENAPGHGNGWEPYPTSLRIVNWIKWSLAGNRLSDEAIQSLAVQTRYLRQRLEIHLLGNHLFANAKALVFAGLFFSGTEAASWLKKGLEILALEVPEQILVDGGHFERSPMYHAIILEDLLDLVNAMRAFGEEPPVTWSDILERMLVWLDGMTHPDGEIVLFNDAAFGIAPCFEQLSEYANCLGIKGTATVDSGLRRFAATGYVRVQKGPGVAFLDVAPIGPDCLPGHAHADTLNFELSLFGQRIIVDSGISCYGTSLERLRQRGTAAHNTVTIDGENSSEVWGGFRVARRARPVGLEIDKKKHAVKVSCSHDGYCRLPGRPVHHRSWSFDQNSLTIVDAITGKFTAAVARYHFHPDVILKIAEDCCSGMVLLKSGQQVEWQVLGGSVHLEETTYHPEFGLNTVNKCIVVTLQERGSTFQLGWI